MWNPPWMRQRLGYFTSPRTIEYRLTRRELAAIFGRSEDSVPHGFCIDAKSVLRALGSDPEPDTAAFIGQVRADLARWRKGGGTEETFGKLKICVYLTDDEIARSRYIDTRAHELLHAKVPARESGHDLRLLRFLERLFESKGEDRFLPLTMSNFAYEMRWSPKGNNIEEVLARVEGFEAAERDIQRKGLSPAYLDLMTSQYGGKDFTRFREALKRTGYTPARVLREALR